MGILLAPGYNDGSSAPSPGTLAQFPTLLDQYGAFRPPWRVPGVDYGVGLPTGTTLKVVGVDTLPTGSQIDGAGGFIRINKVGGSVNFDSWDFGNRGVYLDSNCTADVSITKSNFYIDATLKKPLNDQSSGGSLTCTYSTFDGGGANGGTPYDASLITTRRSGVFKWNYLKNIPYDAFNLSGNESWNCDLFEARFNLFYSTDYASNYHFDCFQSVGGPIKKFIANNNTYYQPVDAALFNANSFCRIGDIGIGNGGNNTLAANLRFVYEPEMGWNTIIAKGGLDNMFQIAAGHPTTGSGTILYPYIHDNYMDPTGITNAVFYNEGSGTSDGGVIYHSRYKNNKSLVDGTTFAAA